LTTDIFKFFKFFYSLEIGSTEAVSSNKLFVQNPPVVYVYFCVWGWGEWRVERSGWVEGRGEEWGCGGGGGERGGGMRGISRISLSRMLIYINYTSTAFGFLLLSKYDLDPDPEKYPQSQKTKSSN
jgi:hypothetical protein